MIRILFFASNPAETPILQLAEEIRTIQDRIRLADERNSLELIPVLAARPDDLVQQLNRYKPQIVHFSGHSNETGEIIMMDQNGRSKPVSQLALKETFRILKDNIRVVVLNACHSATQAEAISTVIDCAIGINSAVCDDIAIAFAATFYGALGFQKSVQDAYDQGKASWLLEGGRGNETPELKVRPGVDPKMLFLIEPADTNPVPASGPTSPILPPTQYIPMEKKDAPLVPLEKRDKPGGGGSGDAQLSKLSELVVGHSLLTLKKHLDKQPSNRDTAEQLIRVLSPVFDGNTATAASCLSYLKQEGYISLVSGNRFELSPEGWGVILRMPRR